MNIKIRDVIISDYKELCEIYEELDELHRINHPELFIKPLDCARAEEYISGVINDEDKAIFVSEVNSCIVGFAECYILKSSVFPVIIDRQWIQLDNIAVKKDYQNSNIGSLLLDKVIE